MLTTIRIGTKKHCFSSLDEEVYIQGDKTDFIKNEFNSILLQSEVYIYEHAGEMLQVNSIQLGSKNGDIFNDGLSKDDIITIHDKLVSEKFHSGRPDILYDIYKLDDIKREIILEKERIDAGYVITKSYPKKNTTKEIIGGFKLETIFEEVLISYIERGTIFGYIGHSCRKVWVDKLIEEICLPVINVDDLASWLTSTDGRRFGDRIEDMVENNDIDGVSDYIKKYLAIMHDKAVIFTHPEHKGNLKSSIEIFIKLRNIGLMMTEDLGMPSVINRHENDMM